MRMHAKTKRDQEKLIWRGAFDHLLNDTRKRMDKQKVIENQIKKREEESKRIMKDYKILRRSNNILRKKLQQEFWKSAAEVVNADDSQTTIGFLEYINLMEKLGYAQDMNDEISRLLEHIWIHLSLPFMTPNILEEET